MASSSSATHQVKYDVFLSFSGEDTRYGFISHLDVALSRRKIKYFIDDEIRRGDEISPSLLKAIEGSKISIVIFSKGYASSSWCLEELVAIIKCRRMYGQIVIPVFYHVDPSHVRKQTGTFGDAFAGHEVRFREREDMVQRWRNALTEAANLSGFDSNSIGSESKLMETIIEHILKRLNDMSSSDNKNLVGVAMKIQKIKSLLFKGSNEVCKVGIWGMGGIGKTTLANAVFNEISSQFEASSFIRNVREASNKNQLSYLQKELLSTILEDGQLNIGLTFTKERLGRKKVLIVFDDVTDLKQIKELIGDLEYLGSESQIIITTRDEQVLKNCGLNDSTIYEVEGLCSDESLRLFKQYAFKRNEQIDEVYMKLSNRVISYTQGLPLALEVLGCFLLGREQFEWESALDELKKSPNEVIQTVLKISYDGLGNREKDLFLDIACFFKGWDKYLVGSFSSHIGISVLIDRALITISHNTIGMHDLIREMGWEIVQQEPVNKLGERSRLWHHDDVYNVLKKNLGTDKIRGLHIDMSKMRKIDLNPHAFSDMDNLRFLIADEAKYNYSKVYGFEGLEFDFIELRCLSWDAYPFKSLPVKFCPENLVVLKMHRSKLNQLWTSVKDLAHLKYINLSYSYHLLKVPDLSRAPNLESLILEGCTSLLKITSPSRNLNKLVHLNLRNCKSLISLPLGIQSKSLRDVIISNCSKLNTAPRISCNMERLCLDGTAIKELSSSIESPSSLVELNLKDCLRLESLPSSVCNLESLHHLTLSGLSSLKFVLGIPCNIKELHLDGTAIKELSSSIENASSLVRLTLKDCSSLESLPDGICKLKSLRYLCISGCSKLARLPEDIGNLKSLEVLEANGVTIRELPSSIIRLENLHDLSLERLERCNSQELLCSLSCAFSGLLFLKRLSLNQCNLTKLPDNIGHLSVLRDLELAGNSFESVPTSIVNLSNLWLLDIRFCIRLQSLPKLPCNILQLKAEGCKLLKALSGLIIPNRGLYNRRFSFINCLNLDWNVVKNVLNDALLEMYSLWLEFRERGVGLPDGVMCFPGSEIPDWFNIQSCGSSIELPQDSFNHKFLGLVFCAIVGVQNHNHSYKGDYHMQIEYELHSKCKDGYNGVSKKLFSVNEPKNIESDHIFLGYNCNTFDFREFSYNTEAIINFSCNKFCLCKITKYTKDNISSQAKIYLKKCGIRLLYTQEFEEPMKRSRCPVFGEEEEQEEVQSKRLKPSKFFKGESGSRSGVHLLPHKKEGEEFSPTTNEPISFTLFDLDEFPGDFIASPISISDPDEDNDGDLVKSQPFTSLDLDDFPQDSVSSPIIIISDSDKDNDG